MPGDEPAAPRRGTLMQLAISAEAIVTRAADITEQEEPEDG